MDAKWKHVETSQIPAHCQWPHHANPSGTFSNCSSNFDVSADCVSESPETFLLEIPCQLVHSIGPFIRYHPMIRRDIIALRFLDHSTQELSYQLPQQGGMLHETCIFRLTLTSVMSSSINPAPPGHDSRSRVLYYIHVAYACSRLRACARPELKKQFPNVTYL